MRAAEFLLGIAVAGCRYVHTSPLTENDIPTHRHPRPSDRALGYAKAGGYRAASLDVLKGAATAVDLSTSKSCCKASCKWLVSVECVRVGALKCAADSKGNVGRNNVGYRNFGLNNSGISNFGSGNNGNHNWGIGNRGNKNLGVSLSGANKKPTSAMLSKLAQLKVTATVSACPSPSPPSVTTAGRSVATSVYDTTRGLNIGYIYRISWE